jgi:hypothetical protein
MNDGPPGAVRRFWLMRHHDATGVSGVGAVAEGCRFSTGRVALAWTGAVRSVVWYDGIDDLLTIHGHDGQTEIVWLDPPPGEGPP